MVRKKSERALSPLDAVQAALVKAQGKGAAVRPSDADPLSQVSEVIPSGVNALDRYVLGVGGFPCRRIVEVFSGPDVGKTSLGFAALAAAQKRDFYALFLHTEDTLQKERMDVFGVDRSNLLLGEPKHLEGCLEWLEVAMEALPKDRPSLFVFDSLAATPTAEELKSGLKKWSKDDYRAKLMSYACRVMKRMVVERRVALVVINQERTKRGVMFGNPTTTPGGDSVKFLASIRLQLWSGATFKVGGRLAGKDVTIKAVKNKLSFPLLKTKLRLRFTTGWDERWSTLNLAKDLGLVPKASLDYEAALAALEADGWGIPRAGMAPLEDDPEAEDNYGLDEDGA